MRSFLRKLRFNIIGGDKTEKYLKYALGEIVLVVIGILIALQINNWNEIRKSQKEEVTILQSLLENLHLAKAQSEELIISERVRENALISILGINLDGPRINYDTISDHYFKMVLWNLETDLPVINTYTDLKFSNKLGLIRNREIKEKFTSMEADINELEHMLDDRLEVQQLRIDDVAENIVNFIPLVKTLVPYVNTDNEARNNYPEILSDQRIRNLFGIKLSMTHDVIENRESLDNEIKALILLIESELKSRM